MITFIPAVPIMRTKIDLIEDGSTITRSFIPRHPDGSTPTRAELEAEGMVGVIMRNRGLFENPVDAQTCEINTNEAGPGNLATIEIFPNCLNLVDTGFVWHKTGPNGEDHFKAGDQIHMILMGRPDENGMPTHVFAVATVFLV